MLLPKIYSRHATLVAAGRRVLREQGANASAAACSGLWHPVSLDQLQMSVFVEARALWKTAVPPKDESNIRGPRLETTASLSPPLFPAITSSGDSGHRLPEALGRG